MHGLKTNFNLFVSIAVMFLFWQNLHRTCFIVLLLHFELKADWPHLHNYPHMPTDYRHTDKHYSLVMETVQVWECRWADRHYQVNYLPASLSYMVDNEWMTNTETQLTLNISCVSRQIFLFPITLWTWWPFWSGIFYTDWSPELQSIHEESPDFIIIYKSLIVNSDHLKRPWNAVTLEYGWTLTIHVLRVFSPVCFTNYWWCTHSGVCHITWLSLSEIAYLECMRHLVQLAKERYQYCAPSDINGP